MTSTTDSSDQSNKRHRTGDNEANDRRAAHGGSAAATDIATDPHALLGTRLEPIMEVLASQPEELQTHIISSSNEVLDLHATIKQRMSTNTRFDKPMKDTSGEVLTNAEGVPLKFVPNSLRTNCKIKASNRCKDDERMKAIENEAIKEHEKHKLQQAERAKEMSKLEITLHRELLRKSIYKLAIKLSTSAIIVIKIKNGGLLSGMKLSEKELTMLTAYAVVSSIDDLPVLNWMGFYGLISEEGGPVTTTAAQQAAAEFLKVMNINVAPIQEKGKDSQPDITQLALLDQEKITDLLLNVTVRLGMKIDKVEQQKEINAALREAFEPQAIVTATEDVDDAMEAEDLANPSKNLLDLIKKTQKDEIAKMKQQLRQEMRKNYLGDNQKHQQSTPIKSGRKSNKTSAASASTKQKQKQKKSALKKQVRFQKEKKDDTPTKPRQSKKKKKGKKQDSQGSRGGSNKGGRGRNAAGR